MTNTGRILPKTNELEFEDYVGLVWSIVNKQRIRDLIEDDDLFQELGLVWLNCKRLYKPSKNLQFTTYFYTAAVNHIMLIKTKSNREHFLWSLDYNISLTPKYNLPVSELYVDDKVNIEQAVINEEIIIRFLKHPYGALAKFMLQGKTVAYAADVLEIDRATAHRRIQKMIQDVRQTQT